MSEPKAGLTIEELAARARSAGLTLSEAQLAEIHKGHVLVARMAERVRGSGHRPREAEPDLVFRARFED